MFSAVSESTRSGLRDRPLAADRAADVVDDEVAALRAQRVDRLAEPARQARPRVVETLRAVGEPEAGKVERDRAQALVGEARDDLAVEERAGRHPVQEQHVGPRALLADEAAHAAGLEAAPGGAVDVDQLGDVGIHRAG